MKKCNRIFPASVKIQGMHILHKILKEFYSYAYEIALHGWNYPCQTTEISILLFLCNFHLFLYF